MSADNETVAHPNTNHAPLEQSFRLPLEAPFAMQREDAGSSNVVIISPSRSHVQQTIFGRFAQQRTLFLILHSIYESLDIVPDLPKEHISYPFSGFW